MMQLVKKFWSDEAGFLVSLELILAALLLVIGLVAGMQVLRDEVVEELADTAQAIGAINQSFQIAGVQSVAGATLSLGVSGVGSTTFTDVVDDYDGALSVNDLTVDIVGPALATTQVVTKTESAGT